MPCRAWGRVGLGALGHLGVEGRRIHTHVPRVASFSGVVLDHFRLGRYDEWDAAGRRMRKVVRITRGAGTDERRGRGGVAGAYEGSSLSRAHVAIGIGEGMTTPPHESDDTSSSCPSCHWHRWLCAMKLAEPTHRVHIRALMHIIALCKIDGCIHISSCTSLIALCIIDTPHWHS